MHQAQITTARTDLNQLVTELDAFKAESGQYPPSLQTLVGSPIPTRLLNIHHPTAGLFRRSPYIYRPDRSRETVDLFAVGLDGRADTEDDIPPSLTDSVQSKSGYRPAR
jgi:Type II secretion system (T2SS), protein G